MACRQYDELSGPVEEERIIGHENGAGSALNEGLKCRANLAFRAGVLNMKLLLKRAGCFLQLLELKVKARIGRVRQHANQRGLRDKLLQKSQTFGHLLGKQPTGASDIAPRSIEVGDETDRNGVCAGDEYDGYRCGCRLGREIRHLSADGNNGGYLPTHERSRKRR